MKARQCIVVIACTLTLNGHAAPGAAPATSAPAAPSAEAGQVDFIEGTASAMRGNIRRALAKGDALNEGDVLVTGTDGEVHVQMADGAYLAARPNTRVRIVAYQAKGEATDRSVLTLVEGSLRVISGWIGRFTPKRYEIRAGVATIGVRGTDHETLLRTKADAEGEAGAYDRVYEGATVIRSKHGEANVAAGQAGFQHAKRAQAPRVLDRVPGFFRAARNDRLFEGRHAQVQSHVEQLREQRRTQLKEASAKEKSAKQQRKQQRQEAREERQAERKAQKKEEHGAEGKHRKAPHEKSS